MQLDSETRQARAVAAIDALEALFDGMPLHTPLEPRHVAVLVGLAGDAVRAALPRHPSAYHVND